MIDVYFMPTNGRAAHKMSDSMSDALLGLSDVQRVRLKFEDYTHEDYKIGENVAYSYIMDGQTIKMWGQAILEVAEFIPEGHRLSIFESNDKIGEFQYYYYFSMGDICIPANFILDGSADVPFDKKNSRVETNIDPGYLFKVAKFFLECGEVIITGAYLPVTIPIHCAVDGD